MGEGGSCRQAHGGRLMGRYLNVDVGGHEETVTLLKAFFQLRGSSVSQEFENWIQDQAMANGPDLEKLRQAAKIKN